MWESRKDSENYREISINNILSRLFAKIIHNKLQENSKHIISENQNDFNPDRGFVDNLFIVYSKQKVEHRTG